MSNKLLKILSIICIIILSLAACIEILAYIYISDKFIISNQSNKTIEKTEIRLNYKDSKIKKDVINILPGETKEIWWIFDVEGQEEGYYIMKFYIDGKEKEYSFGYISNSASYGVKHKLIFDGKNMKMEYVVTK